MGDRRVCFVRQEGEEAGRRHLVERRDRKAETLIVLLIEARFVRKPQGLVGRTHRTYTVGATARRIKVATAANENEYWLVTVEKRFFGKNERTGAMNSGPPKMIEVRTEVIARHPIVQLASEQRENPDGRWSTFAILCAVPLTKKQYNKYSNEL
jgi:hypothetical protein